MTLGHVLVTGAGGFIGGHLAMGFAALGFRVTAQDMAFDAGATARLAGMDLLVGDLAADGAAGLPAADIIIHAAAITTNPAAMGWTEAAHVTANMLPLLAMLRHAADTRPAAFVFLSSSGVFAPGDGSPDLTDTDTPTASGPYSAAKRAGEYLVPAALSGVCQTHTLRLGYLYGPAEAPRPTRQRVSMVQDWMDRAARGAVIDIPDPAPRRDWTYAPDLAPAMARLLQGPGDPRPRHLCNPVAVADTDAADMLRRHFPNMRTRPVPGPVAKAPMTPSRFVALDGFDWTDLAAGLDAVCPRTVPA